MAITVSGSEIAVQRVVDDHFRLDTTSASWNESAALADGLAGPFLATLPKAFFGIFVLASSLTLAYAHYAAVRPTYEEVESSGD